METRRLGNSDMDITRVGFGAWAIGGGDWEFGWGEQADQDSISAIHAALDAGINWIDTAAAYGLGHSEEVVARALKGRREQPYIFTKCSLVWDDDGKIHNSLKADSLRKEVEASLRRLGVDTIDLYQIHWPNPDKDIEEGWEALAKFQEEGKVRYIGVSNFNVQQMQRAQRIAPITSLQPPYSLVKREVEDEILPFCLEEGIGVINYSPMYSGMLTGKMTAQRAQNFPDNDWRSRDDEFQEPRLSRNLALQDLVIDIAKKHNTTAAALSVAWTLQHPAVTAAIVGARNAEQVKGFLDAPQIELDEEDNERLQNFLNENL